MNSLKPYRCARCPAGFDTPRALASHERWCYPIRELPVRSEYTQRMKEKKIALADTRWCR